MNFITIFFILMFVYMVIGLADHLLNIFLFFFKRDDEDEDEVKKPKKKKLVE